MRVAVLGAGPAGVGAAYRCARAGMDVSVYEAAPVVGGHAASITVAGRRVDLGSHRLHPSCAPGVLADLRRLLGDDLRARPRNGRIRLDGRWLRFPLRPGDLLAHLRPTTAVRLGRDVLRRRDGAAPGSYADDLRARFGPVLCDLLWFPYARKLWGLEPEQISVRQAQVRVGSRSRLAVASRALRSATREAPRFWYPRGGFGRICESLADAAEGLGAEIRTGTPVAGVEVEGGQVRAVRVEGRSVEADLVLSTIPLGTLPALSGGAPAAVLDAAASLAHRAMLLVYLTFDSGPVSEFDAHYLPEDGVATARVSEPRHYGGDWPPGRTILCCEVPCTEGDGLWSGTDGAATAVVLDDLAAAGIALPGPVTVAHVVRLPRVYPVYRRGFEAPVDAVESWVRGLGGLVTLGRQGLFLHDNSHHAIEMGYTAAGCVRGGRFDHAAWAQARARFADNVVED